MADMLFLKRIVVPNCKMWLKYLTLFFKQILKALQNFLDFFSFWKEYIVKISRISVDLFPSKKLK